MTGIHQAIAGSSRLLSVPKIESFKTFESSGADGIIVELPSGIVAGRHLIGAVAIDTGNAGDIGTLSVGGFAVTGRTNQSAGDFNQLKMAVFRRTLTGSETGDSNALTGDIPGSSVRYVGFMAVVSGVDAAQPFSSAAGLASSSVSGTSLAPGTLAPDWGSAAPSLFYSIFAYDATTELSGYPTSNTPAFTISYPDDYTIERNTVSTSNNRLGISVCMLRAVASSQTPASMVRSLAVPRRVSHLRAIRGG
jgi:hypothetical protein